MPFVSQKNQRERMQTVTPFNYQPVPEFSEVFNASLGLVIDEELSISGGFDREGLQARNAKIDQLIRSGSEDAAPFTNPRGAFNYGKFAETRQIDGIQTNSQLMERRNQVLAERRTYANDVIERGSGMAQFLGSATGYMLDPINIATMGLSGAVVGAKSLSVMGRALMTARNTAAIGAVSELAIQPLVYIHKQDIESPYAASDAIAAIATTALGAGLLGGAAGGISGYLKSAREAVESAADVTPEIESALESITRMQSILESAPKVDIEGVEKQFLLEIQAELIASAGAKLSRGERKSLLADVLQLQQRINKIEEIPEPIVKVKGVSARKAKAESIKLGKDAAQVEREGLEELLIIATRRLENDKLASASEKELSQLEQGILSDTNTQRLETIKQETIVENESKYLEEIEVRRVESNQPNTTVEDFIEPERPKALSAKVTPREREILQDSDGLENHNRDMAAYANLSDVQKAEVSEAMSKFDDELEGLESVLVCSIA
tara:strand:+ start:798 stop:2288 length:1491 start_codon:yes stop_codon:yes gene_type:complete